MAMVTFHSVKMKNLMSIGNAPVTVELDNKPLTLVMGNNGAGKSTLLEGLNFGLFGKAFRKINKGQLVNSVNSRECVVEVEFSTAGKRYRVVRGISPNVFDIYQDGQVMAKEASTAAQQELLERRILRMNQRSFNQIVVLGAASFTPFMRLSAGERRQFIEDLLDLKVFTHMNAVLKQRVDAYKSQVVDMKHSLEMSSQKLKALDDTRAAVETMASRNDESFKRRAEVLKQQMQEVADNIKDIDKRMEAFTGIEESAPLRHQCDRVKELRVSAEVKRKSAQDDIDFFSHHDSCPTCQQEIAPEFKEQIVQARRSRVEILLKGIEEMDAHIKKIVERLESIDKVNREIGDLITKKGMLQFQSKQIVKEMSALQREKSEQKQVEPFDYSKILEAQKSVEASRSEYDKLQKYGEVLGAVAKLLKDGGIKARIIKASIPVLNEFINLYLDQMNLFVQFNLDEEFNETIKSQYRNEFSYESFSEGEKLRIDLALLFTWRQMGKRRNSSDTNLLIMDEILDSSLDAAGIEDFLKVTKVLTQDCNALIISHRNDVLEFFDRVVEVKKVGNFTEYEEVK